MNDIHHHFLAHAAFAGDQHPGLGRRNQRGIAEHGLHERAAGNHRFRQLVFCVVLERNGFRHADGLPHRIEQFIEVNRLGQIIDRAIAHGGHGIADVGEGGDEQDRQGGVFLAGAPQGFQAGKPRHPHVGNHHGKFPGAEHFQGAFAGIRQRRLKTLAAQKRIQQAALAGIIVHNQDARCFGRMVAGFGHGLKLSDSDAAFQAADTKETDTDFTD